MRQKNPNPKLINTQKTYREIDRIKALQPEHQTLFENAKAVLKQVQFSKKTPKFVPILAFAD